MIPRTLALVVLIACASRGADARTVHVNAATGDDSTSYAQNSAARPWATIGRAAWGSTSRNAPNAREAAQAGDTVMVASGTYAAPGTDVRFEPVYNPVNSGAAGKPIVFQADGTVTLTLSGSRGPLIGASSKSYITWKGFTIDAKKARTRPDTGPVVFFTTTGSSVEDCTIAGDPTHDPHDNHPGVRIEQSHRILVRNNRISGFRTTGVNAANGTGVQVYSSDGIVVENNEISDSGSGIFLKGIPSPSDDFTIRRNLVHDVGIGIIVHIVKASAEKPIRVYQNVVHDVVFGIQIRAFDGANDARYAQIVNNTIHKAANVGFHLLGDVPPDARHVFWNNIVTDAQWAVYVEGSGESVEASRVDFEHNLYHGFSAMASVSGRNVGLGNWRSLTQEASKPASLSTDPKYVNTSRGDFRLQPGSAARSAGIDILDLDADKSTADSINLGAYVSDNDVIGPTAPPSPR